MQLPNNGIPVPTPEFRQSIANLRQSGSSNMEPTVSTFTPSVETVRISMDQQQNPSLNSNSNKEAKKEISSTVQSCGIGFSVAVTVIITAAMVACTVAFAYILSSKDNYTSSQMLVLTGRRTRDWSSWSEDPPLIHTA